MERYQKPKTENWTGRKSEQQLYLHEKIALLDLEKQAIPESSIVLLGYSCDEGVKRNQGRIGASKGPDLIRKAFSKMPNHLSSTTHIYDVGNIICADGDMENTQLELSQRVSKLLDKNNYPILLGGGHDIAYGHYNGLKKHFGQTKKIGIINFDAHFDLRSNKNENNSGTPFYQIGQDCMSENTDFMYLALGIRKDANDQILFKTANELGVNYIENSDFTLHNLAQIEKVLSKFIPQVDLLYVTIDLDGFSSAYAPGVSAPSPMGFSPDVVLKCLQHLFDSKKVVGIDIVEINPTHDIDNQTAKLAASLLHFAVHSL